MWAWAWGLGLSGLCGENVCGGENIRHEISLGWVDFSGYVWYTQYFTDQLAPDWNVHSSHQRSSSATHTITWLSRNKVYMRVPPRIHKIEQ